MDSIKYIDVNGAEQTLATTEYEVDIYSETGRVVLANGKSWPSTKTTLNAVKIAFTAGYGATGATVPEPIRQAIKIMVAEMYERREVALAGTIISKVPITAEYLLYPHRIIRF